MKNKAQHEADIKAKIMEIDAEIDLITREAVGRRDKMTAKLSSLPLTKRMRILAETPIFTPAEQERRDELQVRLDGLNDILKRFFKPALQAELDEEEDLLY
jgi:hypothetical protein